MRYHDQWAEATICETRDLTPSVREIAFRPEIELERYLPGSHVDVHVLIAARVETRSYSLVGDAKDGIVRIAVKDEPESRGGSRYMWSLAPGARLSVSAPTCNFQLLQGAPEYLLIAGGIGITPIFGMASALAQRGERFRLLYAGRGRDEMAYAEQLAGELGPRLELFESRHGRRLDISSQIAGLHPEAEAYLCGPIRMLDDARRAWSLVGRSPTKLRYETFGSSGHYAAEPFVVHIPRLGKEVHVPQTKSMLAALVEAGVGVMSDCRRGECGLCAMDVLEVQGTIDHRDVFFSDHQHAANDKICACVSRVVGRITVESAWRGDPVLKS